MPAARPAGARQQLQDLLVKRATERLTVAERQQLEKLRRRYPEQDTESFDRAAAAILLAVTPAEDSLPASLQRKLGNLARGFLGRDDDPLADR